MRNEIEIMRILRLPPLGKLVVEINEHRYETAAEIADPKLRQRILAAIGELVVLAGGYQNLVDVGVAPALKNDAPAPPAAPAEAEEVSPEMARKQAEFLAQLEAQRDQLVGKPPKGGFRLFNRPEPVTNAEPLVAFTPAGDVKPIAEPAKPQSIAEQIDAILQKHLATDPKMAGRSVRLRQNATGGLRIEVDGKHYEKPTDIPDKDVQLMIKIAVKEWNAG